MPRAFAALLTDTRHAAADYFRFFFRRCRLMPRTNAAMLSLRHAFSLTPLRSPYHIYRCHNDLLMSIDTPLLPFSC